MIDEVAALRNHIEALHDIHQERIEKYEAEIRRLEDIIAQMSDELVDAWEACEDDQDDTGTELWGKIGNASLDEREIELELQNVASVTGADINQLMALDDWWKGFVVYLHVNGAFNFHQRLDALGIALGKNEEEE